MWLLIGPLLLAAAMQTPTPPGRLVDVGGYRVHLYCTGAGRPAVEAAAAGARVLPAAGPLRPAGPPGAETG